MEKQEYAYIGLGATALWIAYVILTNRKHSKDIADMKSRVATLESLVLPKNTPPATDGITTMTPTAGGLSQFKDARFASFAEQPDSYPYYGAANGSIRDYGTSQIDTIINQPHVKVTKAGARIIVESLV